MKEKIKKPILLIISALGIMFIAIYTMGLTGYYETTIQSKKTLTTDAINRFEKDVLNGEVIIASNYLEEKDNYDNLLSRIGIRVGNVIEIVFKKIMSAVLKEIEGAMQ